MSATIAISAVGRRRYVAEGLLAAAHDGDRLIVVDMDPLAAGLHVPGAESHVVQGEDLASRADEVVALCHREGVSILISLHDYEAVELAERAPLLERGGTVFVGPDRATADLLLDKQQLNDLLSDVTPHIAVPTATDHQELDALLAAGGPWVLKDRKGSASSGLAFLDDPVAVREEVDRRDHAGEPAWLVQRRIQGPEFNVDVFVDLDGTVRGGAVKEKLGMRGGETDRARVFTSGPSDVFAAARSAVEALSVTGNVDIDVMKDDVTGACHVIDVNPRFGGGYAFSGLAGYDAAGALWAMANGRPVPDGLAPQREVLAAKHVAVAEVTQ